VKKGQRKNLLDHGHIIYVDHMGTDTDIVDAARVSYRGVGSSTDKALIRYLMRNKHTSPFEMCELKVIIKCPIFVARQWIRHRTASLNEVSGRYSQLPDDFFLPSVISHQATDNKQGRSIPLNEGAQNDVKRLMREHQKDSYDLYEDMLSGGVAKETARNVLTLDVYTEFVWKIDLHNLMHFLKLRCDPHAQYEIRVFAAELKNLAWQLWPDAMEAFEFYHVDGITLSRAEKIIVATALRHCEGSGQTLTDMRDLLGEQISEREWKEFVTKLDLSDIIET